SATILRAVIAALRPRGHGFDQPIDEDVLVEIDRTLPYLPRLSRIGLPLGLRLLEWGPLVFAGRPTRLSRMSRDEARGYLQGWLESRLGLRHLLVYGLRALIFLAFYQHPAVLEAMGVHWDRRLVEAVELRADTLDRTVHGDPH
ncbi:MAG TPA: hypothetical protein VLF14_00555, partial [Candidatus Binatia bacterium]|nr:hypothetical protein [Candidatus Binatia bacterium]